MYTNIVLLAVTVEILIELGRSTESILEVRQKRRDQGEDLKTYS